MEQPFVERTETQPAINQASSPHRMRCRPGVESYTPPREAPVLVSLDARGRRLRATPSCRTPYFWVRDPTGTTCPVRRACREQAARRGVVIRPQNPPGLRHIRARPAPARISCRTLDSIMYFSVLHSDRSFRPGAAKRARILHVGAEMSGPRRPRKRGLERPPGSSPEVDRDCGTRTRPLPHRSTLQELDHAGEHG